jgi:hypothetical protein
MAFTVVATQMNLNFNVSCVGKPLAMIEYNPFSWQHLKLKANFKRKSPKYLHQKKINVS